MSCAAETGGHLPSRFATVGSLDLTGGVVGRHRVTREVGRG
jgi:hypothetical protein